VRPCFACFPRTKSLPDIPKEELQHHQKQPRVPVEQVLMGALRELCGEGSRIELVQKMEMEEDTAAGASPAGAGTAREGATGGGAVIEVEVDGKSAQVDPRTLQIANCSDQLLHHLLTSITQKMAHTVLPI
jgi:hypothetical protein